MTAINSNILSGDAMPSVGSGNGNAIKPGAFAKVQGVKAPTLSFSAALEQHTNKHQSLAAKPRREQKISSEQNRSDERIRSSKQMRDHPNTSSQAENALKADKSDVAQDRDEDDAQASNKSVESDRFSTHANAAATQQEQRDADGDAQQASADWEATGTASQHEAAGSEKSTPCDSDELAISQQNETASGNIVSNQGGSTVQRDTQSTSNALSNVDVSAQARQNPLDSAKPVAQNELVDSAKQQVAATSQAVGESKAAKSADTLQKLDVNPINDAANSRRALNIDSQQQQQSNSNTHHLARDAQLPTQHLPQRSMADNFLHAMQAALRAQNANGNSAPQSGSDNAAAVLELGKSSVTSSSSAISENTATTISPLKMESGATGLANPLQKLFAPINERVGQGQWQQEMSQRINMMLNHQIQNAQIQLHPKHLGAMEISVSMGHDQQVNVSFQVQHAHVKDALDAALPKLRDMLQSQGFSLNHSDISQRQHSNDGQESHQARSSYSLASFDGEIENSDTNSVQHLSIQHAPSGGLDLFV